MTANKSKPLEGENGPQGESRDGPEESLEDFEKRVAIDEFLRFVGLAILLVIVLLIQGVLTGWFLTGFGISLVTLGVIIGTIFIFRRIIIRLLTSTMTQLMTGDEARDKCSETIETKPQDTAAWYNKGIDLASKGWYDRAVECYNRVLKMNPLFADAWYNKGVALANLGKHEESIECYNEAISINPLLIAAWNNKGTALIHLSRYNEAIECYNKAIEINPMLAEVWHNKGFALQKLGCNTEANAAFIRAGKLGRTSRLTRDAEAREFWSAVARRLHISGWIRGGPNAARTVGASFSSAREMTGVQWKRAVGTGLKTSIKDAGFGAIIGKIKEMSEKAMRTGATLSSVRTMTKDQGKQAAIRGLNKSPAMDALRTGRKFEGASSSGDFKVVPPPSKQVTPNGKGPIDLIDAQNDTNDERILAEEAGVRAIPKGAWMSASRPLGKLFLTNSRLIFLYSDATIETPQKRFFIASLFGPAFAHMGTEAMATQQSYALDISQLGSVYSIIIPLGSVIACKISNYWIDLRFGLRHAIQEVSFEKRPFDTDIASLLRSILPDLPDFNTIDKQIERDKFLQNTFLTALISPVAEIKNIQFILTISTFISFMIFCIALINLWNPIIIIGFGVIGMLLIKIDRYTRLYKEGEIPLKDPQRSHERNQSKIEEAQDISESNNLVTSKSYADSDEAVIRGNP